MKRENLYRDMTYSWLLPMMKKVKNEKLEMKREHRYRDITYSWILSMMKSEMGFRLLVPRPLRPGYWKMKNRKTKPRSRTIVPDCPQSQSPVMAIISFILNAIKRRVVHPLERLIKEQPSFTSRSSFSES